MLRHFFWPDDDHPFTGWHMLAITVAFFAVVIAVNTLLAIAATGTFPGLVVENSYVASQNYNELLAGARAQADTGWRLEVAAPHGVVEARFTDAAGAPAAALAVTAFAGRPSSTSEDRSLTLGEVANGYRADAPLPPGQWAIDVEARRNGVVVFREVRRVYVVPEETR